MKKERPLTAISPDQSPKRARIKQTRDADGAIFKRTETINGKKRTYWYARKRFQDERGVWHEKKRRAYSQSEAISRMEEIKAEIKDEKENPVPVVRAPERTFAQLAAFYKENYLKPAIYIGDRKVGGLRSYKEVGYQLKQIEAHFGAHHLQEIVYEDVSGYKQLLIELPTKANEPRSIANVNNKLRILRRLFRIAEQKDWIVKSPFRMGDPLISSSDETERMVILSRDEAGELLQQAALLPKAVWLRPLLLCALDTAMRQGEIFKMMWEHLDFKDQIIMVPALNTKTMRRRVVPMSQRLRTELLEWRERRRAVLSEVETGSVFGITSSVQDSFSSAREAAGLDDLHFHDLRHTGITWMLLAGMPEAKVMKISGHSQYKTFLRYVNISVEIAQAAGRALDKFHAKPGAALKFASQAKARSMPLSSAPKRVTKRVKAG